MANTMEKKDKKVSIETDPKAEFLIGEVAELTGYSVKTLQRLDGDKIPTSHRCDARNARVWYAFEIKKIVTYREKMGERHKKHAGNLFKLREKSRRAQGTNGS